MLKKKHLVCWKTIRRFSDSTVSTQGGANQLYSHCIITVILNFSLNEIKRRCIKSGLQVQSFFIRDYKNCVLKNHSNNIALDLMNVSETIAVV